MLVALLLAGCGAPPADLFVVTRTGADTNANVTLLVQDDGSIVCNHGKPKPITNAQLLQARKVTRDVSKQAELSLQLAKRARQHPLLQGADGGGDASPSATPRGRCRHRSRSWRRSPPTWRPTCAGSNGNDQLGGHSHLHGDAVQRPASLDELRDAAQRAPSRSAWSARGTRSATSATPRGSSALDGLPADVELTATPSASTPALTYAQVARRADRRTRCTTSPRCRTSPSAGAIATATHGSGAAQRQPRHGRLARCSW